MLALPAILELAQASSILIRTIGDSVALGQANGSLTPEQVAAIKSKAGISDAAFDSAVEAAKFRLGLP